MDQHHAVVQSQRKCQLNPANSSAEINHRSSISQPSNFQHPRIWLYLQCMFRQDINQCSVNLTAVSFFSSNITVSLIVKGKSHGSHLIGRRRKTLTKVISYKPSRLKFTHCPSSQKLLLPTLGKFSHLLVRKALGIVSLSFFRKNVEKKRSVSASSCHHLGLGTAWCFKRQPFLADPAAAYEWIPTNCARDQAKQGGSQSSPSAGVQSYSNQQQLHSPLGWTPPPPIPRLPLIPIAPCGMN